VKALLLIGLNVIMSITGLAQDTLIYIGDPMCSWCYGFAPEISKVKESLDEGIEFKLVMGGLRPYNTETMADLGNFLSHHWKDVEKRSKQQFNYSILQQSSFVYDTEPPSRAVWVMRQMNPKVEFQFFKDVQVLFYVQNKNTAEAITYKSTVESYGIDYSEFEALFNSDSAKNGIKQDFALSQKLGIRGFPSVVFKHGNEWFLLANGYNTAEQLMQSIADVKSKGSKH
jgi:putative protein-disulfide isomerase